MGQCMLVAQGALVVYIDAGYFVIAGSVCTVNSW